MPNQTPARQGLTSKVTYRWQTTLPSGVRRALGLKAGDHLVYVIEGDYVLIRKVEEEGDDDPVVRAYLEFLTLSMRSRPDLVRPLTNAEVAGFEELLDGVEPDLDADLGDFELP